MTTLTDFSQTSDAESDESDRPDDCECWDAALDRPCYRDGFDAPNPEEPAAEEVRES